MVLPSFISSATFPLGNRSSFTSTPMTSAIPSHAQNLRQRRVSVHPCASLSPAPLPSSTGVSSSPPTPPPSGQQPKPDVNEKRRDVSRLLSLFARLAMPYWRAEKQARRDIAALFVLAILQSGVSVMFSYISRDFYTALNTRNLDLFYHQAQLFFVALLAATPVVVYYQYLRDSTSLKWRNWITTKVVAQYCQERNFYFLESQEGTIDNPDQRISQDLNSFTTESIAFILQILISCVDLVCFSGILFSIYPALFAVLLAYAATGTVLTAVVGKQLISLNYQQLVKEADFRYSLVRVRENAESIAFFQGERREQSEIMARLSSAVENMSDVINIRRRLAFVTTGYRFSIQILPALVIGPRYFNGLIELGVVTQSFSAFSHILNDLSLVVNRFDSLSQFGAGIDRLAEFVQALEDRVAAENKLFHTDGKTDEKPLQTDKESRKEGQGKAPASPEVLDGNRGVGTDTSPDVSNGLDDEKHSLVLHRTDSQDASLVVENLTLLTPIGSERRTLVEGASFRLAAGERLLLSAPSGFGKTSVLRAVAGLWPKGYAGGAVRAPPLERVFFVPQKPYCTLGTLRQNVVYPSTEAYVPDSDLQDILDAVDLGSLPKRMGGWDAVADWADILSLGEQQRLQFARLLLRRRAGCCDVAVIDEGSSALSVDAEAAMYTLVERTGLTVLSVGHRPSLLTHHDYILRIRKDGSGQWDLAEIGAEQKKQASVQTL